MGTLLGVALHTLTLCRADTVWKDEPFLALPLPLSAAVGEEAKKGGIREHVGRPGTGHGGRQGFQSGCISVSTQFSLSLFHTPQGIPWQGRGGVLQLMCLRTRHTP